MISACNIYPALPHCGGPCTQFSPNRRLERYGKHKWAFPHLLLTSHSYAVVIFPGGDSRKPDPWNRNLARLGKACMSKHSKVRFHMGRRLQQWASDVHATRMHACDRCGAPPLVMT